MYFANSQNSLLSTSKQQNYLITLQHIAEALAFIDYKMRINKLLNVIIMLLIFTPFLKCCEGQEAEPEEHPEIAETVSSYSILTQIDTTSTENSIDISYDNEEHIDEEATNEDELNFVQKTLVFLAYPEGIFTSVSGFGLILELLDSAFSAKAYSNWYFALLVLLSIMSFIVSVSNKKLKKLIFINAGLIILTWLIMILVNRMGSILWGFYLYSLLTFIKTYLIHKMNKTKCQQAV